MVCTWGLLLISLFINLLSISLFEDGLNWPINIELSLIKSISLLEGQSTLKITSDFLKTSLELSKKDIDNCRKFKFSFVMPNNIDGSDTDGECIDEKSETSEKSENINKFQLEEDINMSSEDEKEEEEKEKEEDFLNANKGVQRE